jgi:hypothetical protein
MSHSPHIKCPHLHSPLACHYLALPCQACSCPLSCQGQPLDGSWVICCTGTDVGPDPRYDATGTGTACTYSPWPTHKSSLSPVPSLLLILSISFLVPLTVTLSSLSPLPSSFLSPSLPSLSPSLSPSSPLLYYPLLSLDSTTLEAPSLTVVLTPSWELLVRAVTYLTFYVLLTPKTLSTHHQ